MHAGLRAGGFKRKETSMLREIKKKTVILMNRMPFSPEIKEFAAHIEKKDWLYGNLRLEGSALREEQVEAMLRGEYVAHASIGEHVTAQRLTELLESMRGFASRNADLDLKLITNFHNIIAGDAACVGQSYRKRNMILTEYDYTPVIPAEIPAEMQRLQAMMSSALQIPKGSEERFCAAAEIHNRILEIFPYGETDKLLARAALCYYLMASGYPAVVPDMDESDYNGQMVDYLKSGDSKALQDAVMRNILQKTDLMIQLTAY